MLAGVRHPIRSRIAPVPSNLATLAATAREAVADPSNRHAAVHGVMLASGHAIHGEGV